MSYFNLNRNSICIGISHSSLVAAGETISSSTAPRFREPFQKRLADRIWIGNCKPWTMKRQLIISACLSVRQRCQDSRWFCASEMVKSLSNVWKGDGIIQAYGNNLAALMAGHNQAVLVVQNYHSYSSCGPAAGLERINEVWARASGPTHPLLSRGKTQKRCTEP